MSSLTAPSRTKAQQREHTRQKLLQQARHLFAEKGYANVSLTQIVTTTGVTKGALYHHFASKEELFRVVLEQVHREIADQIAQTDAEADLWTQLIAGCRTFLTATTAPAVQQIMLVDAPSVLGWAVWRQMDAVTSMRQLEEVLSGLVAQGVLPNRRVASLAHLLSGALNEAALWLAHSPHRERDLDDVMADVTVILTAFRRDH